jgi:hypothetical protein
VCRLGFMWAACLWISVAVLSQSTPREKPDRRGELDLPRGSTCAIHIDPSGIFWFGSTTGRLFSSSDGARTWREIDIPTNKGKGTDGIGADALTCVRFFDSRRGLVSGWSQSGTHVLRTVDGGVTWTVVPIATPKPIAGAFEISSDGRAWLAGAYGIVRSDDWGATWKTLRVVSDHEDFCDAMDFVGSDRGIVASARGGLRYTEDGGETWRPIPSPRSARKDSEDEEDSTRAPIPFEDSSVLLLGDRVILEEKFFGQATGRTYSEFLVGSLNGAEGWQPLRVDGHAFEAVAHHGGGLVALTVDRHIAIVSPDLNHAQVVDPGLEPMNWFDDRIESREGRIVAFDGFAHVAVFDGKELRQERLFNSGVGARWPILQSESLGDGAYIGVSRNYLYRSTDDRQTWTRLAPLPARDSSLILTRSGGVLLHGGPSGFFRWHDSESRFEKLDGLDHLYVGDLHRIGDLWLYYGFATADERGARHGRDRIAADDSYTGIVVAFGDGGDTWTVLDRWLGGSIEAVDVDDTDWITEYRAGGGIRRGPLHRMKGKPPTADLKTIVEPSKSPDEGTDRPYVEWDIRVRFDSPSRGIVTGKMFFGKNRKFETTDGGMTWKKTETDPGRH